MPYFLLILFRHLYLSGVWSGVEETPKKRVLSSNDSSTCAKFVNHSRAQ